MRLLTALLVCLSPAFAQTWSLGLTIGGLLTDEFRPRYSDYTSEPHRLLVGPTARLQLDSGAGFEAGALRKAIGYRYAFGLRGLGFKESETKAAAWEFPLLFHYGHARARLTPFVNAGISLRRIAGARQTGRECTQLPTVQCTLFARTEVRELRSPTTTGLVIGGGMEVRLAWLRLSPEVRFTRWLSRPFTDPIASGNQVELLVRIAVAVAGRSHRLQATGRPTYTSRHSR